MTRPSRHAPASGPPPRRPEPSFQVPGAARDDEQQAGQGRRTVGTPRDAAGRRRAADDLPRPRRAAAVRGGGRALARAADAGPGGRAARGGRVLAALDVGAAVLLPARRQLHAGHGDDHAAPGEPVRGRAERARRAAPRGAVAELRPAQPRCRHVRHRGDGAAVRDDRAEEHARARDRQGAVRRGQRAVSSGAAAPASPTWSTSRSTTRRR